MPDMRRNPSNVASFRRPRRRWTRLPDYGAPQTAARRDWAFLSLLIALPLAAFSAVFLWSGPPALGAFSFGSPDNSTTDRELARFEMCSGSVRVNCVVDGDTFWYRGDKIRIADINTPEVSDPACAHEARLGAAATHRLLQLLNDGSFTLGPEASGRDRDKYGRLLRTVSREGESLGNMLVREGLAERWQGYRRDWC